MVRIGNVSSNIVNVPDGIAQGTVLGPLVFIFYINDVISSLSHVNVSMLADDCVLYMYQEIIGKPSKSSYSK